jgi:hypothetical protein
MCLSHLIYTVQPCLNHTCHAAPMPCSDHAVLLKATAHDGLWATHLRSASSGYHAEFHEDCYQKHNNPPHNDLYLRLQRVVAAHYRKDDLLNCWTSSSDVSGYHADFHERHGTLGAGQGRVWINARRGRGTAWAQHGHGMLCVNPP